MKRAIRLAAASGFALLLFAADAPAQRLQNARTLQRHLHGTLVDHTHNTGADYRVWSPALGEARDLYVYLPPGYDPSRQYPCMLWLHGIQQDEQSFVSDGLRELDAAMAAGRMPPVIIAMPDGTPHGRPVLLGPCSFFLNSNLGNFEDYAAHDVWDFVTAHYPVRPEREAHIVAGFSGGGAAAYRIAFKHRDRFGVVFAVSAPLNTRWVDCHGRHFGNFDPSCWGWREDIRGQEVVGRFYGVIKVRMGPLIYPLYGKGPQALDAMRRENPIELLDELNIRPGDLAMLVAYGAKDQFNLDAQTESFVYRARERGLCVKSLRDSHGRHNLRIAEKFLPQIADWLAPRLAPYAPACLEAPAIVEPPHVDVP
jgi:S-formylglutathione hydrolase FrmB